MLCSVRFSTELPEFSYTASSHNPAGLSLQVSMCGRCRLLVSGLFSNFVCSISFVYSIISFDDDEYYILMWLYSMYQSYGLCFFEAYPELLKICCGA